MAQSYMITNMLAGLGRMAITPVQELGRLTPGRSDRILKTGDMILETESALDIEELVSKYVFGDAEK